MAKYSNPPKPAATPGPHWQDFDSYVAYLQVTTAASTVIDYSYAVQRLLSYLDLRYPGQPPTVHSVLNWAASLSNGGRSKNYIYRLSAAAKHYLRWLGLEDIASQLPVVRQELTLCRVLQEWEVVRLFEAIEADLENGDKLRKGAIRNKALLSLMLDTGLRSSEVLNARLDKLNLDNLQVTTIAKGRKPVTPVFSPATAAALTDWLDLRGQWPGKTIFVSVWAPHGPMTGTGLRQICYRLGKKAGIERFSPHALRRTMAHIATRAGAPTRVLMAQGGWTEIDMIYRYTQEIGPKDFNRYSPMQHLNTGD